MQTLFRSGWISGIEIRLDISWLVIALLIILSLGNHFRAVNPSWNPGIVWGTAVITSTLFFACILAHEYSHAAVAKLRGLPVCSITLFALGGWAHTEREAPDAMTEFWVGIVGPIISAIIGVACLAFAWLCGWTPLAEPATPLLAMIVWLGYINMGLATFNLIPAFPLDGGRVLRAIIWRLTEDKARATKRVAIIGIFIAQGFIVLGIFSLFKLEGFSGIWLVLIGWFLTHIARASHSHTEIKQRLLGVCVGDVMARDCPIIDGNTNLQTLVEDQIMRDGRHCFLIKQNGEVTGLITFQEVSEIKRTRRPYTVVYDVMLPFDQLRVVKPETPITEAMELIGCSNMNQLRVMSDGRLAGIISRDHILQLLTTRTELNY